MADSDAFRRELAELIAKHGVTGLPASMTSGPRPANPANAAASYIREIITDGQIFDEKVLDRVVSVLKQR